MLLNFRSLTASLTDVSPKSPKKHWEIFYFKIYISSFSWKSDLATVGPHLCMPTTNCSWVEAAHFKYPSSISVIGVAGRHPLCRPTVIQAFISFGLQWGHSLLFSGLHFSPFQIICTLLIAHKIQLKLLGFPDSLWSGTTYPFPTLFPNCHLSTPSNFSLLKQSLLLSFSITLPLVNVAFSA